MTRVSVVTPETTAADRPFADECHALLDRALAEGCNVLAIVWETPQKVEVGSVPDSYALKTGLLAEAMAIVCPVESDD